ncbi:MAG: type II toxin-antitoxin system RelE/ParE family toxin [Chloroflexi bacterium]|nr:type II toxin-antitoxin system RelE/ParE family toxin [Chloroflexota bacterium]
MTRVAERGLETVVRSDGSAAGRIRAAFDILKENPYPAGGETRPVQIKKLSTGDWRARFGDYRVVYSIAGNIVIVRRVVHRKDAYRDM